MQVEKIASFTVDHIKLLPGLYVSRKDKAGAETVTPFDLRLTKPNEEPVMNTAEVHTIEHLGATYLRNEPTWKDKVLYFGPMGCRTGFYLLMRSQNHERALEKVKEALRKTIDAPEMFGASRKECGNYKELSIEAAHKEAARYLKELESREQDFKYPTE